MATANPVNVRVRLASHADIQSLPAVETSAASRFKSISVLAPVVDGNPTLTTDDFERMLVKDEEEIGSEDHTMTPSLKGLWVAETVRDSRVAIEIVGFIAARSMDQCMFLAEVSVAAAWQGRGIGRRLIEAAVGHARKVAGPAGMTRVTLTTYRDITCKLHYDFPRSNCMTIIYRPFRLLDRA